MRSGHGVLQQTTPEPKNQSLLKARGCLPLSPHPLQLVPAARDRKPVGGSLEVKTKLSSPDYILHSASLQ